MPVYKDKRNSFRRVIVCAKSRKRLAYNKLLFRFATHNRAVVILLISEKLSNIVII